MFFFLSEDAVYRIIFLYITAVYSCMHYTGLFSYTSHQFILVHITPVHSSSYALQRFIPVIITPVYKFSYTSRRFILAYITSVYSLNTTRPLLVDWNPNVRKIEDWNENQTTVVKNNDINKDGPDRRTE